jgi:transcription factor SOX7/8/10/18 (SOX group E/F)
MWKAVSPDVKLQYKEQASAAQDEFKRQYPNYTYRKARRKRALSELLTKRTQGFSAPPTIPPDAASAAGAFNPANPYWQQMYAQAGMQAGFNPAQMPNIGVPNYGIPNPQGYQNLPGYPGFGGPAQNPGYQFPPK